jgi:hypothetical protein
VASDDNRSATDCYVALNSLREGKVISIIKMTVSADGKTMKWIFDDKLQGTTAKGAAQKQ